MKAVMLHPLGYEERPRGHEPDHFKAIEETLIARGHTMVHWWKAQTEERPDVVLFNSGVWNLSTGGTSPYNKSFLYTVLDDRIPIVWFDDFDHAGDDKSQGRWPGSDDWKDMHGYHFASNDFAWFGWNISRPDANRILYFMRKMQIHQDYPDYVHPLEYPIFEDFPLASKDELMARPFDVCGLANLSGPRAQAMIDLYRDRRLKVDCEIIPHYRRLDYKEWLDRHRQAKLFLEADASLGSERPLRLITIAPMLRVKSDHRLPFPRQDMFNMLEVGDYDGRIGTNDVNKILSFIRSPSSLYRIYTEGAEHMRKYYSLESRSNYVVDLIEKFVG